MDFYLSIDGAKKGPYSIFKVGELLESGEVTAETLAWHRDLTEWTPLSEVPALEMLRERSKARNFEENTPRSAPVPPPLPEPEPVNPHAGEIGNAPLPPVQTGPVYLPAPTADAARARPFIRFWARMFDYMAVSVLVVVFSDTYVPEAPPENFNEIWDQFTREMQSPRPESIVFVKTLFLALIGWHFLEAVLIHLFGTTPGKALFNVKVRSEEGRALPMKTSLARSLYVYVMGMGLFLNPLILIGMIFSYFRIQSTGNCLWDQHLKIRVENPPLGALRIGLAFCAFFALLLLQSVKFS